MELKGKPGNIKTTRKDNVKRYDEVWFDQQFIINILALKNIKQTLGLGLGLIEKMTKY